MSTYIITASLPRAGTAQGLGYRIEEGSDPSGFGHVLNMVKEHVGGSALTAIVQADTAAELDRKVRTIGFSAYGEAQVALEDLVDRGLAQRR
jgi:hypothetical protein